MKDQSVPADIPWAVPWDDLEKKRTTAGKGKIPANVKRIRGKLNVPRERFHTDLAGRYLWAGLALGRKPGESADSTT